MNWYLLNDGMVLLQLFGGVFVFGRVLGQYYQLGHDVQ
jgi:hypothetical protein